VLEKASTESLLAIDSILPTGLEVENTCTNVRILSLADLTLAVKIPDWLNERPQDIGTLSSQGVVNLMCRDDVGFTSFKRPCYTKKAD